MKSIRILTGAFALVAFVGTAWAAGLIDQDPHHPPAAQVKPSDKATPKEPKEQAAKMDAQMKAMHEMHEKMMVAKTPEGRQALMADHMKTMHDGMAMMNGMMGGRSPDKAPGSPDAMQKQLDMMRKQMDMMQAMMQMMMDRLDTAELKK